VLHIAMGTHSGVGQIPVAVEVASAVAAEASEVAVEDIQAVSVAC
jgi:hypothetical protein